MSTTDEEYTNFLIHRRFDARVKENPQAPAVIHQGRTVSYGELDASANCLAATLSAAGIGPDVLVGVLLDRSHEAITAIMATWKAGGAYVPLDPAQPRQRLAQIVEDCNPTVIVTSSHLADQVPSNNAQLVLIDQNFVSEIQDEPVRVVSGVRPDNLAYTIYTSGSTGHPKGVEVSHRGLMTSYLGWEEAYDLRGSVRSHLQIAGFGFDQSTGDFARALLSGGVLVLCTGEDLLRPENMYRLITQYKPDMIEITPALLRVLMEHLQFNGGRLDDSRIVTVGGEGWPWQDYMQLRALVGPQTRVFCAYGVTESSVDSTLYETLLDEQPCGPTLPIGRAFHGTRTKVLDSEFDEIEDGAEGELCLTGAGLARGYRGNPALTALRFLPDSGGWRIYRSGDKVRRLPNGDLEHLGRIDYEVKINGVRVQTAEVETALRGHPGVGHAVVVAARDTGRVRLYAYITVVGPMAVTPRQVHDYAKRVLPAAMVPDGVTVLDALPLNASGKVDRRRLPDFVRNDDGTFEALAGSTEIRIAEIWQYYLRLPRVGALDDFFMLGGDSIQSALISARVRREFQADLPSSAALIWPTVRKFAAEIDRLTPEVDPPIAHSAPDERYPLSPTQRRLWLLNLIDGTNSTYNIPIAFSIKGPLVLAALETALNRIVSRHATLRTRIIMADGEALQEVVPNFDLDIRVIDLRHDADSEARGSSVLADRVREPFNLATGPLIRVDLLWMDQCIYKVLVTVHHIVFDGWSAELFLLELGQEYEAALRGEAAALSTPELSYGDISAWQDRRHREGAFAQQLDYWKGKFSTLPPSLDSLADRPRSDPGGRAKAGCVTQWLDPALTTSARACGRRHGSTLFVTLLSCFTVLLSRLTGEQDVTVGTPIAGRDREQTQGLIGFFVNTVAIRTNLNGAHTFIDVLIRVRDEVLDAHSNQSIPFEDVVAGVSAAGTFGRNPLFQTWFNLLGPPDHPPSMPGLETEMLELPAHAALFDLSLYIVDHEDRLRLDLVYDSELFSDARASNILEQLIHVIKVATAGTDVNIDKMSLVADAHRNVLPDVTENFGFASRSGISAEVRKGMVTSVVHDASGRALTGKLLVMLISHVVHTLGEL
ncbi:MULTISPECIES: non-ribosomal peptide synthetase [unclassified Nocardia]|uniref:non-ribosomal peptide synthetase n=1 Tax=unclassified Nocardia TaxID=2637762 RepID=UPI001CE3ECB8|nr:MULTISPECIES: non-ribosomal peptide synthetase [unclassified Nocardia]